MSDQNLKNIISDKEKDRLEQIYDLLWEGLGFAIIFAIIYLIDTYF